MYLHIGNNKNIRVRDIVGIFDADTATVSAITKKYLSSAESEGSVMFASMELPKSFVLYKEKGNFIAERVKSWVSLDILFAH